MTWPPTPAAWEKYSAAGWLQPLPLGRNSVRIHNERIGEVDRYIRNFGHEDLNAKIPDYERLIRYLGKARKIDSSTRILEVGTGTGWFPILCRLNGLQCKGLDISPQLIELAKEIGKRHGVVPDIELGNVEVDDLGVERYDAIVASSVFEHIEFWRPALTNIYRALSPGGALFFESSNKYMLQFSRGESTIPFYGWLPDRARYELRKVTHGKDVMKLGIDFHQFTYPQLRRVFAETGFRDILDVIDLLDVEGRKGLKRWVLATAKSSRAMRRLVLTFFVAATTFVCRK
jgi:2-polyprenyl-3-methyl-5-hydroxy-6-metoxy-1,4-benzoquinol methylase